MCGALLPALHSLHGVVLNGPHNTTLHLFSFGYILVYLTTLRVVPSNEWTIVYNELERLWKEVAVALFKVLCRHLCDLGKPTKHLSGYAVPRPRFESDTFRI
jgi:hypothetical protein